MATDDPAIILAKKVFAGWSSGDPDALQALFHEDATFFDNVNGEFRGWPAIRAMFAESLERWNDLLCVPTKFWLSDDGVAFTWVMTGTIADDRLGEENRGSSGRIEGMAYLIIEDGKVRREADYFHGGSVAASLQRSGTPPS